jgi:hypothetical protein
MEELLNTGEGTSPAYLWGQDDSQWVKGASLVAVESSPGEFDVHWLDHTGIPTEQELTDFLGDLESFDFGTYLASVAHDTINNVVYNTLNYPSHFIEDVSEIPEIETFVAEAIWFKFSQDPAPEKWCTATLYRLSLDLSAYDPAYTATATLNLLFPEYYSSSQESAQAYAEFVVDVSDRHVCFEQFPGTAPSDSTNGGLFTETSEGYESPAVSYPAEFYRCVWNHTPPSSTAAAMMPLRPKGEDSGISEISEGDRANQAGEDCHQIFRDRMGVINAEHDQAIFQCNASLPGLGAAVGGGLGVSGCCAVGGAIGAGAGGFGAIPGCIAGVLICGPPAAGGVIAINHNCKKNANNVRRAKAKEAYNALQRCCRQPGIQCSPMLCCMDEIV